MIAIDALKSLGNDQSVDFYDVSFAGEGRKTLRQQSTTGGTL
jgi:hypothetical protein